MAAKKTPEEPTQADYPAHDNLEAPPDRPAEWEQPVVAPPQEDEGEESLPGEADETVEVYDESTNEDSTY